MIKLGYVAPKRGGKTQFLITMIQEEFSQGHRCYYLGGQKHYEEVAEKLAKAVFTDNITWEMTSIFPYALRAMVKLHGNWYYTIPKEELVILADGDAEEEG